MLYEERGHTQNNHVPLLFLGYKAVSSQVTASQ